MEAHGRKTPILTTLDLLDDLSSRGTIAKEAVFAHRTHLRQAGYQLIPVREDELSYHLAHAPHKNGDLVETAELRAIREAMLKARMVKMLQIPLEAAWLHQSMNGLIQCLRTIWRNSADGHRAAASSEWLVRLTDVRGWAASALAGNEKGFAVYGHAAHVFHLITLPDDLLAGRKAAYFEWIDERLLKDIRETEPEMFAWIVERAREFVDRSADELVKAVGS
jgi:hypothetical protein